MLNVSLFLLGMLQDREVHEKVPTNLGYHRPYSSLTTTELDKPTNLKCLKSNTENLG